MKFIVVQRTVVPYFSTMYFSIVFQYIRTSTTLSTSTVDQSFDFSSFLCIHALDF